MITSTVQPNPNPNLHTEQTDIRPNLQPSSPFSLVPSPVSPSVPSTYHLTREQENSKGTRVEPGYMYKISLVHVAEYSHNLYPSVYYPALTQLYPIFPSYSPL